MKKLILLVMTVSTLFVSCSKDDNDKVPETVIRNIKGNYYGDSGVSHVKKSISDTLKTYATAVVDNKIHINGITISTVVDSIFGRGTAATQGISQKPVELSYRLYNAHAKDDSYYPLTYSVTPIAVNVNKSGQSHKLKIEFFSSGSTVGFSWYYPNKNSLDITLVSSSIKVDDKEVTHFASKPDTTFKVQFLFPIKMKKR